MNKMKKDTRTYIVVIVLIILFIFSSILVFVDSQTKNKRLSVHCKFDGIELVNVTPYTCWYADITTEYCPIPKGVDCDFEIQGLAFGVLSEIVK